VLEVLAHALQRLQLGHRLGQLGLGFGNLHRIGAIGERLFGFLLGTLGRGLVQISRAGRGVGQHGDHLRLHFQDAAGDIELQPLAIGQQHVDVARLEPGDQRRVAWRDAQLTQLAGGNDHRRVAREDRGFGTDDVDAYGLGHESGSGFVGRRADAMSVRRIRPPSWRPGPRLS
jgi:hypothetical protein